jgi:hypothetical protein
VEKVEPHLAIKPYGCRPEQHTDENPDKSIAQHRIGVARIFCGNTQKIDVKW